jgi:hypothetical protein
MLGRRSLNLELANFDSEIERTIRDNRRIAQNLPVDSQNSESDSEKSMNMGERNPPRSIPFCRIQIYPYGPCGPSRSQAQQSPVKILSTWPI